MIRFKILAENRTRRRGIIAEHGLSIVIETTDSKVLFDVGQTDIFLRNAEYKNVNLSDINHLVLSHGHYDHTGGVPQFCRINKKALIYIHPSAMNRKEHFNTELGTRESVGIQWISSICTDIKSRMVPVAKTCKISEQFFLSGEICVFDSVDISNKGLFSLREDGVCVEDDVIDEQFLIVRGRRGNYIFLGCSHRGVINCIRHAKTIFPNDKIEAVIGGMHLENAPLPKISKIISQLGEYGIAYIYPLHCTGIVACSELKRIFKDQCVLLNCGDEILLED